MMGRALPLPNLIVIGAPKCGTTSLHSYLSAHPDVFMSATKEIGFFASRGPWTPFKNADYRARDLAWYSDQFISGRSVAIRGESSTNYSREQFAERAASLIGELLPGVRIIYMVRDPIERIRSDYVRYVSVGDIPAGITLSEILTHGQASALDMHAWWQDLIFTSMYARQLKLYRLHVPDSRIHIVPTHELQKNQRKTLQGIFQFLGIDQDFWCDEYERRLNARSSAYQRRSRFNVAVLRLVHELNIGRLVPPDAKESMKRMLLRRVNYEALSEIPIVQRQRLAELFAPDLDEFLAMTGIAIPMKP